MLHYKMEEINLWKQVPLAYGEAFSNFEKDSRAIQYHCRRFDILDAPSFTVGVRDQISGMKVLEFVF